MPLSYLQTILNAFESLDIAALKIHLKERSYQETTKEVFLEELNHIFESHLQVKDTELLTYKGVCSSKTCDNCGKSGYRFVGNHSNNHLSLIFEMDGDDILDIFYCTEFKTDEVIDELKSHSYIYINKDEEVDFTKTDAYLHKVNSAVTAYNEIVTSPPQVLNFKQLCSWLDKHSTSNLHIGSYSVFKPHMKWTPFSSLYADLSESKMFISKNYHQILLSNNALQEAKEEQDFINWIIDYHHLNEATTLILGYQVVHEDDYYIINQKNPIILKGFEFENTFNFITAYQKYNEELLQKYATYTKEEESAAYNNIDYKKVDRGDVFSLKYHLDKRKELESKGIHLPLYLKRK